VAPVGLLALLFGLSGCGGALFGSLTGQEFGDGALFGAGGALSNFEV
jgi:hypothetical protein